MENEFNEEWPKRINVIKVITYDTEIAYEQLLEDNRANDGELNIEFDDILEKITNQAKEDFGCGWGHQADISDLIITDENGDDY
jgi:hypothetical protein